MRTHCVVKQKLNSELVCYIPSRCLVVGIGSRNYLASVVTVVIGTAWEKFFSSSIASDGNLGDSGNSSFPDSIKDYGGNRGCATCEP